MMNLTAYFQQLLFVLVLVACLTSCRQEEVDDEKEFSYKEKSKIGPAHWGEIRPGWKECNSGKMQSPIDLVNQGVEIVSNLGPIDTAYKPSNATLINKGHYFMLSWGSGGAAGYIQINGTLYRLTQCHWHSPSEHKIHGKRLDLEFHIVHHSNDNRTAVIAILYKIGHHDQFLSMMKRNLEAVKHTQNVRKRVGIMDPKLIKLGSKSYYRYMGSLTTPPCTEGVIWTILRQVRRVSREQVEIIRDAIHDGSEANARPIQPLNERTVELYKPTDPES